MRNIVFPGRLDFGIRHARAGLSSLHFRYDIEEIGICPCELDFVDWAPCDDVALMTCGFMI